MLRSFAAPWQGYDAPESAAPDSARRSNLARGVAGDLQLKTPSQAVTDTSNMRRRPAASQTDP